VTDAPTRVAELARTRARADATPIVTGIAGAVASGKSTLAAAVAEAATTTGVAADVVSTDGFLFRNVELQARGLIAHKGFPESYDVGRLRAFVGLVHSGASEVMVPHYSHEIYDVGDEVPLAIGRDAFVILEGVNALGALDGHLDFGVYLHAEEADLERWYVTRFLALVAEAHDDASSFYRRFIGMDTADVEDLARQTWRSVNLVNLRDHIAPTRALADCVVVKGPDHTVTAVEVRDDRPADGEGSRP